MHAQLPKVTSSGARAPGDLSSRTPTFTERVAYQYAIEEVYWRHRIWPKDNLQAKPALDMIISRAQVEKKVENYLAQSQLISVQRGWPIRASELQAEMDRMARDTKQPDVLRELFAALGNDPFVIAECLARPLAAERLVSQSRHGIDGSSRPSLSATQNPAHASMLRDDAIYKLPQIVEDCANDSWTATTNASAPDVRTNHTAIWTGSEMVVWGGHNVIGGQLNTMNTGAKYDSATDAWISTSVTNAPLGREFHTAVWTGSEMLIFGGENYPTGVLNTGGKYNPITNTWIPLASNNAPVPREQHNAVWTGGEMIVWGGRDWSTWFNSGGRYDPNIDRWTATSTVGAPERRWYHTAEWTDGKMIVWGGTNQTIALNTGGGTIQQRTPGAQPALRMHPAAGSLTGVSGAAVMWSSGGA